MVNNLPFEKKERAISELCEGTSIRAIERMTGVHRDTITPGCRINLNPKEGILELVLLIQLRCICCLG